jgi:aspartate racemase
MPLPELRRIGLIGGTSWQSTLVYYRLLNDGIAAARGGSSSAAVTIHSVDFEPVKQMQHAGDWDGVGALLAGAARDLEAGGAKAVAVAANTLHLVSGSIRDAISVPFVDLIDEVDKACTDGGWTTVGLLGTAFTMESQMYPERLQKSGIDVLIPSEAERSLIHRVIYDELTRGIVNQDSRAAFGDIIGRLADRGAQAVILGCTEIILFFDEPAGPVPLLDTTEVHCRALIEMMLTPEGSQS